MSKKRNNWLSTLNKNRTGIICEIKVFDEDNRKLDFFKFHVNDKNAEKKIAELLKNKYEVNLKPEEKIDKINYLDKDINW